MLGAIIGDIVGSIYEWNPIKTKDFNLFHPRRYLTDDSVCTAAVADILLHNLPPAETMQYGMPFLWAAIQTRSPPLPAPSPRRCTEFPMSLKNL